MSRRTEKVSDQLQVEIADLLRRELRDPALEGVMISITQVEVTADFASARVHVSLHEEARESDDVAVMAALDRSSGFLHRQLVRRLAMRRVPRLQFKLDRSLAEGARIAGLMREVARAEGREPQP